MQLAEWGVPRIGAPIYPRALASDVAANTPRCVAGRLALERSAPF